MRNLGFAVFGLCVCVTGCRSGQIDVPAAHCASVTEPADVQITVKTHTGPNGAAQPVPAHELTSVNIYDQDRSDYMPHASDNFVNYLKALRPAHLRWPAGYTSQTYTFTRTGPESAINLTPALLAAYIELCQRVGAQPMIGVNVTTGTPDNAADLVRFVNKEMGYNVVWWELGNEPDVDGVDATHSPAIYAQQYLAVAAAMRAVDSSIKLAGGVLLTGENILGEHQSTDWLTPIMEQVGNKMDAISWHYYPLYSTKTPNSQSSSTLSVAHLLQEDASDWPPAGLDFADTIMPHLRSVIAKYTPGSQIWISEFAEDPGYAAGAGLSDANVGALWAADALGRYADYGIEGMYKFLFKAEQEHRYTLVDENLSPRPEYYTYWLYGQQFGDTMVNVNNDHRDTVAAHAALRSSDGTLTVMLINKAATSKSVRLALPDFSSSSAQQYVLSGSSYEGTDMTLNGQQITAANVGRGGNAIPAVPTDACPNNVITLPPFTVQLMQFTP